MIISPLSSVTPAGLAPDERPQPTFASHAVAGAAAPVTAPEGVKQAMQMISEAAQKFARNLQFSIDNATGKTVVKVVDALTGDTIRQIPSEEALDIARALDRTQGLLSRQKA